MGQNKTEWVLPSENSERHDTSLSVYDRFSAARRDCAGLEQDLTATLDLLEDAKRALKMFVGGDKEIMKEITSHLSQFTPSKNSDE